MRSGEERFVVFAALLVGLLMGANQTIDGEPTAVPVSYIYWVLRIFVEAALFFAIRLGVEKFAPKSTGALVIVAIAIVLSHLIFVPMITAIDIVMGFPELGIGSTDPLEMGRQAAFAWELVYLLDNHIFLCLLLSLPRLIGRFSTEIGAGAGTATAAAVDVALSERLDNASNRLIDRLNPPLVGRLQWIEAQEHYVRITTDADVRMELCRFSDIVADLSPEEGMQTHRSHWVSLSAVKSHQKEGQNLQLKLHSGDLVPVSRSHRAAVLRRMESLQADGSDYDFPTSL